MYLATNRLSSVTKFDKSDMQVIKYSETSNYLLFFLSYEFKMLTLTFKRLSSVSEKYSLEKLTKYELIFVGFKVFSIRTGP